MVTNGDGIGGQKELLVVNMSSEKSSRPLKKKKSVGLTRTDARAKKKKAWLKVSAVIQTGSRRFEILRERRRGSCVSAGVERGGRGRGGGGTEGREERVGLTASDDSPDSPEVCGCYGNANVCRVKKLCDVTLGGGEGRRHGGGEAMERRDGALKPSDS